MICIHRAEWESGGQQITERRKRQSQHLEEERKRALAACRAGCLRCDTWDALFFFLRNKASVLNELTGTSMNILGARRNVWGSLGLITEPCHRLLLLDV